MCAFNVPVTSVLSLYSYIHGGGRLQCSEIKLTLSSLHTLRMRKVEPLPSFADFIPRLALPILLGWLDMKSK
jgi:hypothetical protein